jgi:hypothetical protein
LASRDNRQNRNDFVIALQRVLRPPNVVTDYEVVSQRGLGSGVSSDLALLIVSFEIFSG